MSDECGEVEVEEQGLTRVKSDRREWLQIEPERRRQKERKIETYMAELAASL